MISTVKGSIRRVLLVKPCVDFLRIKVEGHGDWRVGYLLKNKRRAIQGKLIGQVESLRVEIAEHPLFNSRENFDKRLTFDLSAIGNPGDDGAECLFIELCFFFKEGDEFILPVVIIDPLSVLSPVVEHFHHVLIVLVV